jgi:hypothetical protein
MGALSFSHVKSEMRALEAALDRAGHALGCAFSSAAEFEAAVIRARVVERETTRAARLRAVLSVTAGACALAFGLLLV